jgi:2-dehydro-3-deoxyglucarate aldolase
MPETDFNPLKTRLAAGQLAIGGWLSTGAPQIAEAMASLGFHWIALDMEHGSADLSEVEAVFMALERHNTAAVVRISNDNVHLARRLLDLGAKGLIVSTVEDAARFRDFAAYCLYPPTGKRGVGLSRCNRWGDDFDPYLATFRPVLIPQIETLKGVGAAEELAGDDAVDGFFFGPYDLSCDLGKPAQFATPEFQQCKDQIKAACARYGKASGMHQVAPDTDALQGLIDEGFRFVAYGNDVIAMRHALSGIRPFTSA